MKRAASIQSESSTIQPDSTTWEIGHFPFKENVLEFPALIERPAASHSRGIVYFLSCLSMDAGFLLTAFMLSIGIHDAYSRWVNPLWPIRIAGGITSYAFLGLCVFITLTSMMYEGIYNTGLLALDRTEKITRGISWAFFVLIAVSFILHKTESMSRSILFMSYTCFLLLVILCRPILEKRIARNLRIHPAIRFFSSAQLPDHSRIIMNEMGFHIDDMSADRSSAGHELASGISAYGSPECTGRLIQMESAYREIGIIPPLKQITPLGAQPVNLHGMQIFVISHPLRRRLNQFIKRGFDLVTGICLLSILAPACLVIAFLIWLDSGGPILYCQQRLGRDDNPFTIFKFRTMSADADRQLAELLNGNAELKHEFHATFKLKKDPRITRAGRWLRRTSLDELPQLWNVLHGEMSLVGPRAIIKSEQSLYGPAHQIVRTVKPGITGIWQTCGRSDSQYSVRRDFDLYYVRNWSLWLDLSLLIKTLQAIVLPGAY